MMMHIKFAAAAYVSLVSATAITQVSLSLQIFSVRGNFVRTYEL